MPTWKRPPVAHPLHIKANRDVRCPRCKAEPGTLCETARNRTNKPHPERIGALFYTSETPPPVRTGPWW